MTLTYVCIANRINLDHVANGPQHALVEIPNQGIHNVGELLRRVLLRHDCEVANIKLQHDSPTRRARNVIAAADELLEIRRGQEVEQHVSHLVQSVPVEQLYSPRHALVPPHGRGTEEASRGADDIAPPERSVMTDMLTKLIPVQAQVGHVSFHVLSEGVHEYPGRNMRK
jgi:hypothetical protein